MYKYLNTNKDNPPAIQVFHLPAFPPVLAIPSSHSDDVASSLRGTLATSSSDSRGVVVGILSGGKKGHSFSRVLG